MKSLFRARWALWLLGVAITVIHLPALLGGIYFLDVYLTEVHPNMVALGRALSEGHFPFWEPSIMLGYPLASNPQVGVFYLPHVLGSLLLDAHSVLSWSAYLHALLAGWATVGLAKKSGASELGALVAGVVYACSPFLVFYHQAIHGLVALAYLPLIVWCTWVAAERRCLRRWAVGAALLALQMYAGHLQFVLYTGVLALAVVLWGVSHGSRKAQFKSALMVLAQGAVALLLYAPQLLSAYVLWRNSLRSGLGAADMRAGIHVEAMGLDDLVELLLPNFWGGPSLNDFWYPEFIGGGALIALTIAIVVGFRSRHTTRFWALLTAGSMLYLGLIQMPLIGDFLLSLPVIGEFRAPGRLLCWILLGAAILAGVGVDQISATSKSVWVAWSLLFLLAVATLLAWFAPAPRDPEMPLQLLESLRTRDALALLAALAALAVGALMLKKQPTWGRAIIAASVALPVLWVAHQYNPVIADSAPSPIVKLLKYSPPAGRILGVSAGDPNYMASVPGPLGWPHNSDGDPARAGWSLQSNVAMAHGFHNMHAQTSLPLRRFVHRFYGEGVGPLDYPFQSHPTISAQLLRHANVSHVVAPSKGQMPVHDRPQAIASRFGYTLFSTGELPGYARFYPAELTDGRRSGWEQLDASKVIKVAASRDAYNAISAQVHAPVDGVLLIAESWYPGWHARVDGRAVEIGPADGAFIGVPLVAGDHAVELRFAPVHFYRGLPLAGFGLALLILAFWIGGRPTRGRQNGGSGTVPT